jgi:hypothetical protein
VYHLHIVQLRNPDYEASSLEAEEGPYPLLSLTKFEESQQQEQKAREIMDLLT